ncbi:Ssl1-like-domain-containing protein [Podospora appendiculata]|uniref:General transcription and DNA repair factor IIH n=1 Tax=Podospora appendiculata TaxID=314037 RepID=A0AAE0X2C9_9PEZI|nr:Ssl1-like-domain-containing protein [Podospora appendiculata]
MADSEGEYVEGMSDDELGDSTAQAADGPRGTIRTRDGRAKAKGDPRKVKNGGRGKAAWEDIQRSWEDKPYDLDGAGAGDTWEAEKRRRMQRDTTPIQRGIIRHLMLVLDMSFAMTEKDLLPNRYRLTLRYAIDFVREYYEQNPISQLGIVGMRDGIAVRISDMSGNPAEHMEKLREWLDQQEPQGSPSLQNALEMCRGALFHAPSHGTREVLIIYGALLSSDPGDIHDTITSLIADRIRVSIIGLSAQVAICAELCSRTNNDADAGDHYWVALHEQHFRELFLAATNPPATGIAEQKNASLLMMGFPSRTLAPGNTVSMCACHNKGTREGFHCTRCRAKVCRLPAECPVCGLTLILSTHLARSYHHLFPLKNWVEVPWTMAHRSVACYACQSPFPPLPSKITASTGKTKQQQQPQPTVARGVSESSRYACTVCGNHFCFDCDVFSHEVVHNCPGCLSDTTGRAMTPPPPPPAAEEMEVDRS